MNLGSKLGADGLSMGFDYSWNLTNHGAGLWSAGPSQQFFSGSANNNKQQMMPCILLGPSGRARSSLSPGMIIMPNARAELSPLGASRRGRRAAAPRG